MLCVFYEFQTVCVVAIEVRQDDVIDVGGGNAHIFQLLVDGLTLLYASLIYAVEHIRVERFDLSFFIEFAVGAHISMPTAIDENFSFRVFDIIC